MRRPATIGIVLILIAGACGDNSNGSASPAASTTGTTAAAEPSESTAQADTTASEPETADPSTTSTSSPPTTLPVPFDANAIAVGLDSEPQFDFLGQPAPDADLNATLIVGSPLKAVVTSQNGFRPGCLGLTIWNPNFIALNEGYRETSPGGCDTMAPPVVFPATAMLVETNNLIVIELGEMPDGPFFLAYQLGDEGGSTGTFRNNPDTPTEPVDLLDIRGFDIFVAPTGHPLQIQSDGPWQPLGGFDSFPDPGTCVADDQTLCLGDNRFQVQVDWMDGSNSGPGSVFVDPTDPGSPGPADPGFFYFFESNSWELIVKVFNGCEINNSYWLYAAATTDVDYTLTVTDTLTNEDRLFTAPDQSSGGFNRPIFSDGFESGDTSMWSCP